LQPETWAFDYGEPFTDEVAEDILSTFEIPSVKGLTVLGGEPMEPENQRDLLPFLEEFKQKYPSKTLWLYTGNTYEELTSGVGNHFKCTEYTARILDLVDILVDGRFEEENKSLGLRFRGSSNQRVIDMNQTRTTGSIVIWDGCRYDKCFSGSTN
jgi:anaerobic ribonucleoside-triphosphate reductase activating protein